MDERTREAAEKSFRRMVGRLMRGARGSGGSFRMRTTPSSFYAGDAKLEYTMADLGIVRQLDDHGRLQRLVIETDETADEAD
jgi:hypothetical protein